MSPHSAGRRVLPLSSFLLLAAACVLLPQHARAQAQTQQDATVLIRDGGGSAVLESILVPPVPHVRFSLTLVTEWAKPIAGGGSFTVTNTRPIKRDSTGRIYEERWGLVPKDSDVKSRMDWIQIADPNAHTLYNCNVRQHSCLLLDYRGSATAHYQPSLFTSGPLPDGKGTRTHEDLGTNVVAGAVVHGYRDTTILNPGVFGNDRPMTTVREFHYSTALSLNLHSIFDTPSIGRQTFTVTQLTTEEPDAAFFQPPAGYTVLDHRKTAAPAQ